MKYSELKQIIKEEAENYDIFNPYEKYLKTGALKYDDNDFLAIIWNLDIENLKTLKTLMGEDIVTLKELKQDKSVITKLYERALSLMEFRCGLVEDVMESKIKNPNYIPQQYKPQK